MREGAIGSSPFAVAWHANLAALGGIGDVLPPFSWPVAIFRLSGRRMPVCCRCARRGGLADGSYGHVSLSRNAAVGAAAALGGCAFLDRRGGGSGRAAGDCLVGAGGRTGGGGQQPGPRVVSAHLVPEWVVDRPAEVSHRRSLRRSGYWRRCKRNQS